MDRTHECSICRAKESVTNHSVAVTTRLQKRVLSNGSSQRKNVNIHTDSQYVFSAVHHFSKIWKHRGFKTSTGKLLTHAALIQDLLDAVQKPAQLALCKCAAHQKDDSLITRGNNFADQTAKTAAQNKKQEKHQMYTEAIPLTVHCTYALVIVCAFSKWVEIYPTKRNDALTVAKCLCNHFSLHTGYQKS